MTTSESGNSAVVIVAGGAGAIGRAITDRLIDRNSKVAVFDRDVDALAEISEAHGADSCLTRHLDMASAEDVDAAVESVVGRLGPPELVISSVGTLGPHEPAAWQLSDADWKDVIGVNLLGPINLVRAVLPHIERLGRPVQIVLITSLFGFIPDGRLPAYAAAKHALVSYAESLRLQLQERGLPIEVTIVGPGGVATGMNLAFREANNLSVPADWLAPEEVASQLMDAVDRHLDYLFSHDGSRAKLSEYFDGILATASR